MGPHRCWIIGHSGLSDGAYTDISSLKLHSQLFERAHLSAIFNWLQEHLAFPIIAEPGMGFLLEQLLLTLRLLSSCANFGSFNVCCLKMSSTLSFDVINHCNWPLLSLHHVQLTIQCCMKPQPLFSFKDFKVSVELLKLRFLLPPVPSLLIVGFS